MFYRKIERDFFRSLVKLITMGIGVASSLILFYIIVNEFNTDSFYKDKNQIQQVFVDYKSPDWNFTGTQLMQPFIPALVQDFSEIETGTVIFDNGKTNFVYHENSIEANTIYADSLYFKVFSRAILEKKTDEILSGINTAVITKKFAKKCFGDNKSALSKIIYLNGSRPIEVIAVIEDWPANSSQTADVLLSFSTLKDENRLYMGWGGGDSFQGFIKLNKNVSAKVVEAKIPDFIKKYVDVDADEADGMFTTYLLVSISVANLKSNPDKKIILYIMLFVGILILGLVCFNALLINLSAYNKFLKDISIRRVLGASLSDLQRMILLESMLNILVTISIAIMFIWFMNPLVGGFYNFNFFDLLLNASYFWISFLVLVIIFLVNYLVPFNWIIGFFSNQNNFIKSTKNNRFQSILLTIQIGISLSLAIFLYFIHAQLSYANNYDKAYTSDNLIYIELNNEQLYKNHLVLKNEVLKLKNVQSACLSDGVITQGLGGNGFYDNPQEKDLKIFRQIFIDEDFFKTLRVEVKGTDYTKTGENKFIIVNKEVGNIINTENPIGKRLYRGGDSREIKAVVPNLITGSLHTKTEPSVFSKYNEPSVYSTLSIRLSKNGLSTTLKKIKDVFNKIVPNQYIQIKFYNSDIEKNYQFDKTIEKTISFFALLAILITISGLIGFSINIVNKRTKEIGIRKVNGATSASIIVLFNKSFLLNILIAILIFIPISYYLVELWLQNYAYAIDISIWVFLLASLLIGILVLATVSIITYKYANNNPIKILRYE